MSERLGKAVLDLEANLAPFERNMKAANRSADSMQHSLDAIAAVARIAEIELNKVKMDAAAGAKSASVANQIERSVGSVGKAAMEASAHLEKVKLNESQAVESRIVANEITNDLQKIERQALRTRAATGGGGGRNGVGVGPFGSGFGRVGLLGAAVGAGTLLGPAAGPGSLGALAAIPVLAGTGAGALGTLALAFDGVFKAIGGDKKAFDKLQQSQQGFVLTVRSLDGALDKLKQTAGAAMFPGLTEGLKSALSPGTMGAITTAVTEFGKAIGSAGAAWGRYFGSEEFQSIFGPLMAAGAKNLSLMSDAALNLFDAIGTLGRAAIPLTSWMVKGADAGSRWVDSFIHAKDATGGLSGAMREAKTSLQLVGGLFAALGKAVYELGAALYPVSKVAVKDLTGGLSALAGIIERNRQTIRDIVGGALAAFVAVVKTAAGVVGALWPVLQKVVDLLGGWKTTFEILIGLKIASLVNGWAMSFVKLAGAEALGGAELKSAGLLANLTKLKLLGPITIAITVDEIIRKITGSGWDGSQGTTADTVLTATYKGKTYQAIQGTGAGDAVAAILAGKKPTAAQLKTLASTPTPKAGGWGAIPSIAQGWGTFTGKSTSGESSTLMAALEGLSKFEGGGQINVISGYRSSAAQQRLWDASVKAGHPGRMPNGNPIAPPGTSPHESGNALDGTINIRGKQIPLSALPASVLAKFGLAAVPGDVNHVQLSGLGSGSLAYTTSTVGTVPPFTKNLGPKPPKPPVIPASVTELLGRAKVNAANASVLRNTGGTAKRYLVDELVELSMAETKLHAAVDKSKGKARAQLETAMANVEVKMTRVGSLIHDALAKTGAALLPDKLKTKLARLSAKFTADSAYASLLSGQPFIDMQVIIEKNLGKQAATLKQMTASLKAGLAGASAKHKRDLQAELKTIAAQIKTVQTETLNSLESAVQALQGKAATAFQAVTAQLDAAFQAKTQGLLDALGVKYFQNGGQTDSEKKLADMQRQDTQDQLQQNLADAQKAVADAQGGAMVYDASTGKTTVKADNQALVLAQKQLVAAQRAISEDELQAKATKERTDADKAYAAESKKLQEDRSAAEAEMNVKLAALGEAFQNGTGTMAALKSIAAEYGVVIGDVSIPGSVELSGAFSDLSAAASALVGALINLASAIAAVTGVPPDLPPSAQPVSPTAAGYTTGSGASYSQAEVDAINASYIAQGIPGRVTKAGAGAYFQSHIGPYGGKPLPMADGGMGTVSKPTLFMAGEAGKEDFAFSGAGRSFGDLSTSTKGQPIVIQVSGVVGNEAEVAMRIGRELQKLNRRGVKFELA